MLRLSIAAIWLSGTAATLGAIGTGSTGVTARIRRAQGPVVSIPAGEFLMGTTLEELERRVVPLCQREPAAATIAPQRGIDQANVLAFASCLGLSLESALRGCTRDLFEREYGQHRVWLRAFGIDRTEVTVGAYARCVAAGACTPGSVAPGTALFGGASQPMVGVDSEQARAYCAYVGGRLPTEAEWERAARGRDARPFPWGFQFDPRRANHGAIATGCYATDDGYALTAPVGSFPDGASPEGALDMAGNVSEWTADLWDELNRSASQYPQVPGARRVDPRGASNGALRVVRGGGYSHPAFALRTTYRGLASAGARLLTVGFRCAHDLPR